MATASLLTGVLGPLGAPCLGPVPGGSNQSSHRQYGHCHCDCFQKCPLVIKAAAITVLLVGSLLYDSACGSVMQYNTACADVQCSLWDVHPVIRQGAGSHDVLPTQTGWLSGTPCFVWQRQHGVTAGGMEAGTRPTQCPPADVATAPRLEWRD